ncbi:MAG TPA: aminotransferase class V-fold PLP-dependent enzyme [Acidimicrobiales bacterium]
MDHPLLDEAVRSAIAYIDSLPDRPVGRPADVDALRTALGAPLTAEGDGNHAALQALVAGAEDGIVATAGPRYFGFVIGGSLPVGLAAEWLASAWDQNAGMHVAAPAVAVIEDVVLAWLRDLLGLPENGSGAFVTGAQMANVTGLMAARHQVLEQAGWDVEVDGLFGAPPVTVVVGGERHAAVDRALRYLGFGTAGVVPLAVDDQGALDPSDLARVLGEADGGPAIVCTQAGNVNTGAFDPIAEVCAIAHEHAAWVHVDGAFGLWAAASSQHRHLLAGYEAADSWAVDMHKWLNAPYDCAVALTAHPEAHRAAMAMSAAYLTLGGHREPIDWNPEMSRRARAVPTWAILRALGRDGVEDLVVRFCTLARRAADQLGAADGVEVLNDVVLNQLLVRFGDDDDVTRDVITRVQEDGTCWVGGTVWQGRAAMRISVSNWSTTDADIDRSVEAMLTCFTAAG